MEKILAVALERTAHPIWKFYSLFDNPHLDISHPLYHDKGKKDAAHH